MEAALPDGLPQGIVWIQYRTEHCRILPVFGKAALKLSPRVGHLHVRVDDLPWLWAHTSELVDPMHQVYPGQSKTVKFTIPKKVSD